MNEMLLLSALICVCVLFVLYYIFSCVQMRELSKRYETLLSHQREVEQTYREKKYYEYVSQLDKQLNTLKDDAKLLEHPQRQDAIIRGYKEILHFSSHESLASFIDEKLYGYATELQTEYSDLSEKEISLSLLYLLQVPDVDILLLLDYSQTSLPTIKGRLCKKFGLKSASDLQNFLLSRLKYN